MRNTVNTLLFIVALVTGGHAAAVGVPGQGTWETTLQPRDANGDGVPDAFYDTALNITWLARTATFPQGIGWAYANAYANSLDYGGYSDWRLPDMVDTGSPGCDFSFAGGTDCGYNVQTKSGDTVYSELAYLWYVELGNKAVCDPITSTTTKCVHPDAVWGLTNTGPFADLQDGSYWLGLTYSEDPDLAWYFAMFGSQGPPAEKRFGFNFMAVRPGDSALSVPEPGSYALLLAGLATLLLVRRTVLRAHTTRT